MAVQRRILKALEDLDTDNFKKFQWQLQLGVSSYEPIPKSHLEHASRIQTVTKIVEKYGEDKAEEITIQTLKEIDNNDLAEKLKKACSEGLMAPPSTTPSSVTAAAAPATMLAQDRSAIIAPTISNSTTGAINISFSST